MSAWHPSLQNRVPQVRCIRNRFLVEWWSAVAHRLPGSGWLRWGPDPRVASSLGGVGEERGDPGTENWARKRAQKKINLQATWGKPQWGQFDHSNTTEGGLESLLSLSSPYRPSPASWLHGSWARLRSRCMLRRSARLGARLSPPRPFQGKSEAVGCFTAFYHKFRPRKSASC